MHEGSAAVCDGRRPPGLTALRGHMAHSGDGRLHQLFGCGERIRKAKGMLTFPIRPQSQSSQHNSGEGDGSLDNAEDCGPRRGPTMLDANISIHILT